MGPIAERLGRRTPTAAQRYSRPLNRELVAVGVEDQDRPLHQVRPIVEGGDLHFFIHGCPPSDLSLIVARSIHVFSLICQIFFVFTRNIFPPWYTESDRRKE